MACPARRFRPAATRCTSMRLSSVISPRGPAVRAAETHDRRVVERRATSGIDPVRTLTGSLLSAESGAVATDFKVNGDDAFDIFYRPLLELLARPPKLSGPQHGLELTRLRLDRAGLLAKAPTSVADQRPSRPRDHWRCGWRGRRSERSGCRSAPAVAAGPSTPYRPPFSSGTSEAANSGKRKPLSRPSSQERGLLSFYVRPISCRGPRRPSRWTCWARTAPTPSGCRCTCRCRGRSSRRAGWAWARRCPNPCDRGRTP
jgi:hypothetical protein